MPDEATSATPAAASVANAVQAPAPEPAPDLTAPDAKDRRLDKQIERALTKGRAKIAAATKGTPPKGADGKFQKRAAAAAETKQAPGETKAAPAETTATEAETPKPAAASGKSAREMLEAGDLDGAFEAAFGKKPQDFKIDSRRWEEWRKAGSRQKAALETQKQELEASSARDRKELADTLDTAKKELGPLLEGRKLFAAKDYIGAIRAAFDVDVPTLQKLLLAQHHGKNPEVEQLRRELSERDQRAAREREELEQRSRTERERAQVGAYLEQKQTELIDGADPVLAAMATKPRFMQRVFQVLQQHYDPATRTTLPTHTAAEMVRKEIESEFGPVLGRTRDTAVTVETAQPGSKAVSSRKGKAPATSLPQRGAAEASLPGPRLTAQQQVDKFTAMARAEAGLS